MMFREVPIQSANKGMELIRYASKLKNRLKRLANIPVYRWVMLTVETPNKTKVNISRDGFHNLFWDDIEQVYKIVTNNFYMSCIAVNKINDINIYINIIR